MYLPFKNKDLSEDEIQKFKYRFCYLAKNLIFLVKGNCITLQRGTYTLCAYIFKKNKNPELY